MNNVSRARLQVILRLDPGPDAGRVVRMWFEQAWDRLGGVFRDQLVAHPLLIDDILEPLNAARIYEVFPQIGLPWCTLINYGGDYGRDVVAAHTMSSRSWNWFLHEVEADVHDMAYLTGGFIEKEAPGYLGIGPGWPDLRIASGISGRHVEQVRLGLSAHPDFLAGTAEEEAAVCSMLYDVAASSDPTYGEISVHNPGQGSSDSLLESSLGEIEFEVQRRNRSAHPRDQLKGYSWVTVVPGALANRLGGVVGLRATGAFHAVEALPAGGVWIKATEQLADYNLEAAKKVFDVLRPVLMKGRPARTSVPNVLVDEEP